MKNLSVALLVAVAAVFAPMGDAKAQVANVDAAVAMDFAQSFNHLRSSQGFGSMLYDTEMSRVALSWLDGHAVKIVKGQHVPESDDVCARLQGVQTCGIMLTGGPQINSGDALFSSWRSSLSHSDSKDFARFGLAAKQVSGQWLYLLVMTSQKFATSLDRDLFLNNMVAFRKGELGGVQNLKYDDCLDRMAKYWATYHGEHQIVNEHEANGSSPKTRADRFGCAYKSLAENIDRLVSPDAARTLLRMQNSPPHRANLLLSGANRIGLACMEAPIRRKPMTAKTICVLVVARFR